jgi:hypothetical protein
MAYSLGFIPRKAVLAVPPEGVEEGISAAPAPSGRSVVVPLYLGLTPQAVCPCPFRQNPCHFKNPYLEAGVQEILITQSLLPSIFDRPRSLLHGLPFNDD